MKCINQADATCLGSKNKISFMSNDMLLIP